MKKKNNLLARLFRVVGRVFVAKETTVSSDGVKLAPQSKKPTKEDEFDYYRFRAGLRMLGCFVLALIFASFAVSFFLMNRLDKCFYGGCAVNATDVVVPLVPAIACLVSIVYMLMQTVSFIKLCFKSKTELGKLDAKAEKQAERYFAAERRRQAQAEAERKKAEENAKMWTELWDMAKGLAAIVAVVAIVFIAVGGVVSFSGWFIGAFGMVAFLLLLILLFK